MSSMPAASRPATTRTRSLPFSSSSIASRTWARAGPIRGVEPAADRQAVAAVAHVVAAAVGAPVHGVDVGLVGGLVLREAGVTVGPRHPQLTELLHDVVDQRLERAAARRRRRSPGWRGTTPSSCSPPGPRTRSRPRPAIRGTPSPDDRANCGAVLQCSLGLVGGRRGYRRPHGERLEQPRLGPGHGDRRGRRPAGRRLHHRLLGGGGRLPPMRAVRQPARPRATPRSPASSASRATPTPATRPSCSPSRARTAACRGTLVSAYGASVGADEATVVNALTLRP